MAKKIKGVFLSEKVNSLGVPGRSVSALANRKRFEEMSVAELQIAISRGEKRLAFLRFLLSNR